MLSKIKAASVAAEMRTSSLSQASNASDNEDESEIETNDTNNNNNNNINNNQQTKKTQDELLDIVEVSRKRRLSKDSADSLTSFIRWSFSHIDPSIQRLADSYAAAAAAAAATAASKQSPEHSQVEPLDEEDMIEDADEADWTSLVSQHRLTAANNRSGFQQQVPEQLLRQHTKLSGSASANGTSQIGGGSSVANLTLVKNEQRQNSMSLSSLLTTTDSARLSKRPRTRDYSPESKQFAQSTPSSHLPTSKKSSNYLGSVVDRIHQQQQQQQQQQQHRQQSPPPVRPPAQELDSESNATGGISFHLQQYLQQQTSLEDLCSSVGVDDSNQLVLVAAIHRALLDSATPNGGHQLPPVAADNKSTASSTGSSSGSSNLNLSNSASNFLANSNANLTLNASSGANLHLVDSFNRQRRAYNTRASALQAIATPVANHHHHHLLHQQQQQQQQQRAVQSAAMNMSNRVQQQRHAQAAAALSALASAGTHHSLHGLTGATPTTPMIDFKCDTCPSSFDDRHRLMQHQSIHLELKKDWFTETPVDEVMKIFNRRRGEFLCNVCNLRFEATLDYDQHNHAVHGARPYCCQFCGNGTRTFKCWRQYLNHLYDHRYIFSCTIDGCDFTVNRRDSLRFHIFRFHLNCQLPQNQQQQLRGVVGQQQHMADSRWANTDDDDDEDTENEMNVAD